MEATICGAETKWAGVCELGEFDKDAGKVGETGGGERGAEKRKKSPTSILAACKSDRFYALTRSSASWKKSTRANHEIENFG